MASEPGTSTLEAARAHARRQAGRTTGNGPTVPATAITTPPTGVDPASVVWAEVVGCGNYASRLLRRGTVLRVADPGGDACVQLLVHRAANPAERLNVADTVKVQWQAYLGQGALLLSDMGRVLLTLIDDTSGRHDALCGGSNRRRNDERYGDGSASGPTPNARDLLVLAVAKHGLGRVDVPPAVNLFKSVRVADDGTLAFEGAPLPGTHVDLRAEIDVIVSVANVPHPLDPRPTYEGTPAHLVAWTVDHPDGEPADDPWRATSPERERAFENTDELRRGADR